MHTFSFDIYSANNFRWFNYKLTKTHSGWIVELLGNVGDCDPDGRFFFTGSLQGNKIDYPDDFCQSLYWLWERLDSRAFNKEDEQVRLQELADWVSSYGYPKPLYFYREPLAASLLEPA